MKRGKSEGCGRKAPLGCRAADLCVTVLKWLLCLLFFGLLAMNLLCFSNLIDNAENVEYITGLPLLHLLYCAAVLAGAYALYRSTLLEKLDRKKLEKGLWIFVAVFCVIWIFMAYDITKYDSHTVVDAAEKFLRGDYSPLAAKSSYLQRYPYQLPFVFCVEQIYRITGPGRYMLLRLLNVCCLVGIYKCILKICDLILPGEAEKKMATLFLYGFWQPFFLSTFIYSLIPSMLCALWAVYQILVYAQGGGGRNVIVSGVLLGLAIVLKSNAWINWIAFAIILALMIARGGKKQVAGTVLIAAVIATVGGGAANLYYQKQSGYPIESGTPKVLWLAMGLQEGDAAPGWYNGFPYNTLKSVDFDAQRAAEIGKAAVKDSLAGFVKQPAYAAKFFAKKEASLWCEPTYECINNSCHREREKPLGDLARSVYTGNAREVLLFHFRSYQLLSILGALLYCVQIKRGAVKVEHLIIPLTILGGFLFHTFMEAKSSYVFPYYTMMVPISSAGLLSLFSALKNRQNSKGPRQGGIAKKRGEAA